MFKLARLSSEFWGFVLKGILVLQQLYEIGPHPLLLSVYRPIQVVLHRRP
jgi:hypothetical protein